MSVLPIRIAACSLVLAACVSTAPESALRNDRFDKPDAAYAFERAKRVGSRTDLDTRALYRAAEDAMRAMPGYSTTLDRFLERRDATQSAAAARNLGSWIPLGPGNIGGRTRTLVINPSNPQIMYAGGVSGGIWKTTDGGARWDPIGDRLVNIAVNSLAIDPRDPATLYAGTGEGYFREDVRGTGLPLRGGGIFVTHDGGVEWALLPGTDTSDFHWVNDLAVSRVSPDRLFAATRTGVWRFSSGRWSKVLDPGVKGGCLDLAMRTDVVTDYLFASCGTFDQATVYRQKRAESDDAWEAVLSDPGMGRTSLAIAPSNQSIIYAIAASNVPGPRGNFDQGLHAVFRSASDGDAGSWSAQLRNDSADVRSTSLFGFDSCAGDNNTQMKMGWYVNTIAVDPVDPDRLFAGGVNFFRSTDAGKSWTDLRTTVLHVDQHVIAFHPQYDGATNQTIFVGNDGGIQRTDNALAPGGSATSCVKPPVTWVSLNHNLGITQFYHGSVSPDGSAYLGGTQDNGTLARRAEDGPDAWRMIGGGDGGYVAFDPQDPAVSYYSTCCLVLTRVSGSKATRLTTIPDETPFVAPFALDPAVPKRLWVGGTKMWRSDDSGAHWVAASDTLAGSASAIAIAPANSNFVIAGSDNGSIYVTSSATSAVGESWMAVHPRDGFVSSIVFDSRDTHTVYATYAGFGGKHVWKSSDAGTTWRSIDGETAPSALPDIPVHSIVVDPTRAGRLFLGTDLGVFVSVDDGAHWAVENGGFPPAVTEALTLSGSGREVWLFAFTHGRGVWKVRLGEASRRRPVWR